MHVVRPCLHTLNANHLQSNPSLRHSELKVTLVREPLKQLEVFICAARLQSDTLRLYVEMAGAQFFSPATAATEVMNILIEMGFLSYWENEIRRGFLVLWFQCSRAEPS